MPPGAPHRGFFGKIPSRGDFVSRGLPAKFQDAWEAWAGQALIASRTLLGDRWDAAWMVAPIWRFALPAGVCGPDPVLGLMMPSIDRVGRCYPLLIASVFPGATGVPVPEDAAPFLDAAEDAARSALADDLEPDALAARIGEAVVEIGMQAGDRAVWWTDGAPAVPATTLVLDGMPAMPDHAAMMAGGEIPGGACR